MPRTPLHDSLGETGTDLHLALVERACAEGVVERENLDWKRELPLTADKTNARAKQHQQLELAKDIAGMANSGGGMIVYGVEEKRVQGTSAAEAIVPVGTVDEDVLRDIRRVAGNLVYPPVTGLDLILLTPSSDPAGGVLVLLVPDSFDRPHLVHPSNGGDWFGAPYRHGPDTEWMVERQLAGAYAEREAGRQRRVVELDEHFRQFTDVLPQVPELRWVVAVAVPQRPHPRPRELTGKQADDIIAEAWASQLCSPFGPRDLTRHEPTRRGLQRFTRAGHRDIHQAGSSRARARVEVHGDGAIALAFTRDGAIPGEGHQATQVPVTDIESTARDFLALLLTAQHTPGVASDYSVRLTVHPPTEIFRQPDTYAAGTYARWDEQRTYGYRPVDGLLVATADRSTLISSWLEVVTDAVNQAGVECTLSVEWIEGHLSGSPAGS